MQGVICPAPQIAQAGAAVYGNEKNRPIRHVAAPQKTQPLGGDAHTRGLGQAGGAEKICDQTPKAAGQDADKITPKGTKTGRNIAPLDAGLWVADLGYRVAQRLGGGDDDFGWNGLFLHAAARSA